MRIREMSDVHLEFAMMHIPALPNDDKAILVIAGDLGVVTYPERILAFLRQASQCFRAVIYVFGNHEFYSGGVLNQTRETMRELIAREHFDNVHILENESIVFDDVAFIGATLWTDIDHANPMSMVLVGRFMADYDATYVDDPEIKGLRRMRPEDTVKLHLESRKYIFAEVERQKQLGNKTVVVVHHGVTCKSTHPRYKESKVNGGFVSDLDNEIIDANPDIIFHGHVHDAFDYYVDEDNKVGHVIANPRGYPGETGKNGFNEMLYIEI